MGHVWGTMSHLFLLYLKGSLKNCEIKRLIPPIIIHLWENINLQVTHCAPHLTQDMILENFKIGTSVHQFSEIAGLYVKLWVGDVLKVPLKNMESCANNKFVWSNNVEHLNTYKDDILCKVPPAVLLQGSASAWSFGLHKDDLRKTQQNFLMWLGRDDN